MAKRRRTRQSNGSSHRDSRDSGVGPAMPQLKKPRLDSDDPSTRTDGSLVTAPDGAAHEDHDGSTPGEDRNSNEGWQTVEYKSSHQGRKRDQHGNKTKYPELVHQTKQGKPISIADLQQLILYTLADGIAPSWVAFKYSGHTRKVVTLMIPGLEKEMFDGCLNYSDVPSEVSESNGENPFPHEEGSLSQNQQQREFEQLEAWKKGEQPQNPHFTDGAPFELSSANLPSILTPIADVFRQVWPVRAPGDSKYARLHSPLQAMLLAPIPQSKHDKNSKGPKPPAGTQFSEAVRTPVLKFVHSVDELRDAEFPIHPAAFGSLADAQFEKDRRERSNQTATGGWVDTAVTSADPALSASKDSQDWLTQGMNIYAIDCEMVLTEDDVSSLARISVLDWSGKTVLDKYVKPSLPVKNYFTQFSGITPGILEDVTTSLADIQAELLRLFTPSTIILGHSLESDLNALKLTHPFIVDTSLIYPHPRGPPLRSALKYLAQKYLRREIQLGGEKGHNSVEDALAVLDLVKLKCEKGPKWGTSEASGEPIFRRIGRTQQNRTTSIVDYGTPARGYGREATHAIGCSNDDEIVQGVLRAVNGDKLGEEIKAGGTDYVWARLRELESYRGWCNNNRAYGTLDGLHATGTEATGDVAAPALKSVARSPLENSTSAAQMGSDTAGDKATSAPSQQPEKATLISTLATTISHIKTIYEALPPCTLFMVYSGTGDPREVGRLQKMQSQYRKEFKVKKWDELTVKWTDTEEQALRRAVEKARDGVGFMTVK